MRQNQQNKQRMRGRPNRKAPNPLTRSFDSNGPDIKIRGTALHIAEKYTQLARDASSSGDRVMAENYLQHAEHYYRIIAAAQAAQAAAAAGRDATTPLVARKGRASYLGERSAGHMDPGATSAALLFDALTDPAA